MAYELHKISALAIEDNLPMLELVRSLLLAFGVGHVYGAKNGEEGYEKFCALNPDLVIADWMMKPTDGITLTRRIRTDPRTSNPYVPVILMTGFSEKRRVIEARDAGVTEFLVKPFNARDLYRRLAQIIERPRQFIKSDDFFGPDRRRIRGSDHQGPFRRETDFMNPEMAYYRLEQQKKALEAVESIRQKAGLQKGEKFDLQKVGGSFLDYGPDDIDMV